MKKKISQRKHAKDALKERYGIAKNRMIYFRIQDCVKDGLSECLMKQSNTRSLHKVTIHKDVLKHSRTNLKCKVNGKLVDVPIDKDGYVTIYVVYDTMRHELVTALPWHKGDGKPLSTKEFLEYHNNEHEYVRI